MEQEQRSPTVCQVLYDVRTSRPPSSSCSVKLPPCLTPYRYPSLGGSASRGAPSCSCRSSTFVSRPTTHDTMPSANVSRPIVSADGLACRKPCTSRETVATGKSTLSDELTSENMAEPPPSRRSAPFTADQRRLDRNIGRNATYYYTRDESWPIIVEFLFPDHPYRTSEKETVSHLNWNDIANVWIAESNNLLAGWYLKFVTGLTLPDRLVQTLPRLVDSPRSACSRFESHFDRYENFVEKDDRDEMKTEKKKQLEELRRLRREKILEMMDKRKADELGRRIQQQQTPSWQSSQMKSRYANFYSKTSDARKGLTVSRPPTSPIVEESFPKDGDVDDDDLLELWAQVQDETEQDRSDEAEATCNTDVPTVTVVITEQSDQDAATETSEVKNKAGLTDRRTSDRTSTYRRRFTKADDDDTREAAEKSPRRRSHFASIDNNFRTSKSRSKSTAKQSTAATTSTGSPRKDSKVTSKQKDSSAAQLEKRESESVSCLQQSQETRPQESVGADKDVIAISSRSSRKPIVKKERIRFAHSVIHANAETDDANKLRSRRSDWPDEDFSTELTRKTPAEEVQVDEDAVECVVEAEQELTVEQPEHRVPKHNVLHGLYAEKLQERQARRAQRRRRRAPRVFERMQTRRATVGPTATRGDSFHFDDYDWLAKYCILDPNKVQLYKITFDEVDEDETGHLDSIDTMVALRAVNPHLNDDDEKFMQTVLELTGYSITSGTDYRLFAVLAALSERITSLDEWMKSIIRTTDCRLLASKLFMCKTLWELCADPETRTICIDDLCVELRAGGVREDHELQVREKLGPPRRPLDLLDFLTYVPLFIMIHTSVVDHPLNDVRDK